MKRLFLSRSEKRGLLVLLLLLLCVSGGIIYVRSSKAGRSGAHLEAADSAILEAFKKQINTRESQHKTSTPAEYFTFNPNTADSVTLLRLGLKHWQIKNMMAYRRAGGLWKDADDFKRLYGLTQEEFLRLRPYIDIPQPVKREYYTPTDRLRQDSLYRKHTEKFDQLTVLDLNDVDTLTLRQIPGVGPYYSRAIVRYRERLGGFVSTSQLREIEGLPERIEEWFTTEPHPTVRTIPINKSDFKTLMRHPYLNYEQVKVIVTHIHKYGPLRSWTDLQLYPEFTPQDFQRLAPYFAF